VSPLFFTFSLHKCFLILSVVNVENKKCVT
jgi:hypothetical protein